MQITDFLDPSSILIALRATGKRQVLEALAHHAAPAIGLSERAVLDVLLERERLGTTGIGRGIAVPHGRPAGLDRLYGVFARMETPVAFDAIDDAPIDLVFMLLAPEAAGTDHLKALGQISRALRDRTTSDRLRRAENAEAAMQILLGGTGGTLG